MKITPTQRDLFAAVFTVHPRFYRAADHGERVTLASLYRHAVLERRTWRGTEGATNAAYEYRLSEYACLSMGIAYRSA